MNDLLIAIEMTIKNTPWWVFLIFFYCVFVGVKSSKDGVVSIKKLMIIPIVFMYLSLESVYLNFKIDQFVVLIYLAAIVFGVLLGLLQAKSQGVSVDKEKKLVAVPGSWATLVIIMIIFFSKYYFGYALGVDPGLKTNTHFEFAILFVSGTTAGMFVGRLLFYLNYLKKGPWVELVEDD